MSLATGVVLLSRVLADMAEFWDCSDSCMKSLPEDLGLDGPNLTPQELQDPRRLKLHRPELGGASAVHEAQAVLQEYFWHAECRGGCGQT